MAPKLPIPGCCCVPITQSPLALPTERLRLLLLPRTTKRGVRYGWNSAPPRNKHARFNQAPGLPALTTGPAAALKRKEYTTPLRTGVLAIKKGMTAIHSGKNHVPCTVLQLNQVQVVATKTVDKHGYYAVQLGCGARQPDNVTRPQLGYYEAKGIAPKQHLAEFKVRTAEGLLPVGMQLFPDWFAVGQQVDARADCKGKGFAGGMKRWGFSGQEASHGNSKNHRTIGSVGASQGSGSRVYPGKKMPGRMGGQRVTVQNLRVMRVDNELGIVVVSGPVAGPKGGVVMLADAIKRKQPSEFHRTRALEWTKERNPNLEEKHDAARKLHLELKAKRAEKAESA